MDIVLEEDIARALSTQFGFPYVRRFSKYNFPADLLNLIGSDTALAHLVFPLKLEAKTLHLAMSNPLDMALHNDLAFKLGLRISPCVTTASELKAAIKKHYLTAPTKGRIGDAQVILLVDDQEMTLTVAEAALKNAGYDVYKASNGTEGLRIAAQLRPNLIVTDILMPRMGGVGLFNALQANSDLASLPVIALTAKSSPEFEAQLLDMGFYDFIAKPINAVRLVARVKRALKYNSK